MYAARLRTAAPKALLPRHLSKRSFTATGRQLESATSGSATTPTTADTKVPHVPEGAVPTAASQAPNRAEIWSRNQRPRAVAMTGPRFEQTDFELQPRPYAAIELIHKQPVRWTHDRMVACDGGGGPEGHPRVFINTDKAEIATCGYCGLPFANEHNRTHLESLPETSYPLQG
ncbi:hypothetical protein BT67DRAFT_438427 [Trichocladium antarcticum]|uniref:Zinc finger CHCC-type domain-containing protein n=1 Tax=Trichocladium antarcticum TaxID=1450529 RepID=A0AAN6UQV7_9PEZI|nr:hypothetical protein BT67DRAFT_438427 [Trichocladium antarcticum]